MDTAAPTAMPTDPGFLTLVQWLSPNFPLGAFAYSHGLEVAVRSGWVHDADSLQDWLEDVLRHGSGRNDAIWLRLAHAADTEQHLLSHNETALAFAPSVARRREAERQGAAFVRTVRSVWGLPMPNCVLPIAVGWAAKNQNISVEMVVPLYLHAFVSNLVAAAQRLMPMGQTDAQAVLAALHDTCCDLAVATEHCAVSDLYSNAFLSDVCSMRHEQLEPRIFQS